jgi:excisionase family DNA binding protein
LGKTSKKPVVSAVVSAQPTVERRLRLSEAAALLGISRPTLYRLLPRIRHDRVPCGGLAKLVILIPESALAAFLRQYEHIPGDEKAGAE